MSDAEDVALAIAIAALPTAVNALIETVHHNAPEGDGRLVWRLDHLDEWRSHTYRFNDERVYSPTVLAQHITTADSWRVVFPGESTNLEGATENGPRDSWPASAGEFAARWNDLAPERREEKADQIVDDAQTAARCRELHEQPDPWATLSVEFALEARTPDMIGEDIEGPIFMVSDDQGDVDEFLQWLPGTRVVRRITRTGSWLPA